MLAAINVRASRAAGRSPPRRRAARTRTGVRSEHDAGPRERGQHRGRMAWIILALPGAERLAESLAQQLHCAASTLELHRFPDGESVVRLRSAVERRRVLLVAHLDHPDDKTLPLLFAADAARELGASELG